jgi:hypothetical protein
MSFVNGFVVQASHSYQRDQIQEFFLQYMKRGPHAFRTLVQALEDLGYTHEARKLEGSSPVRNGESFSSLESPSELSNSSTGNANGQFIFESPGSNTSSSSSNNSSSSGLGLSESL